MTTTQEANQDAGANSGGYQPTLVPDNPMNRAAVSPASSPTPGAGRSIGGPGSPMQDAKNANPGTGTPANTIATMTQNNPTPDESTIDNPEAEEHQSSFAQGHGLLADRAMLVSLKVTGWPGTAQDKKVAEDVAEAHNAVADVGRYSKRLLPKVATQEISALGRALREVHENLTLPWTTGSCRLLPIEQYQRYLDEINPLIEERVAARQVLLDNYNRYIAEAQLELGDLYHPEEYPSPQALGERIGAEYSFTPVPEAGHFVTDLAESELIKLRDQIERQNKAKLEVALADMYRRFSDAIAKASEKLTPDEEGKEPILRESVLTNLKNAAATIPGLNLKQDPELNQACEQLNQVLDGVEASHLRSKDKNFDAEKHAEVRETLETMNRKFSSYFGPAE